MPVAPFSTISRAGRPLDAKLGAGGHDGARAVGELDGRRAVDGEARAAAQLVEPGLARDAPQRRAVSSAADDADVKLAVGVALEEIERRAARQRVAVVVERLADAPGIDRRRAARIRIRIRTRVARSTRDARPASDRA